MQANIPHAPRTGFDQAPDCTTDITGNEARHLSLAAKRGFDIIAASFLLLILLPLFLIIALFVSMDGGPVFFGHKRVGRGGKTFACLKFRTMITDAEEMLEDYLALHPEAAEEWRLSRKLEFDPRVTSVGRVLRATSLDELPQLFNVIKGEMSLVGPRPITETELDRYGSLGSFYKAVRPGITGLWQVNGRNELSFDQRMFMDVEYVKSWSLFVDGRILLKTPGVVLSRGGAR